SSQHSRFSLRIGAPYGSSTQGIIDVLAEVAATNLIGRVWDTSPDIYLELLARDSTGCRSQRGGQRSPFFHRGASCESRNKSTSCSVAQKDCCSNDISKRAF